MKISALRRLIKTGEETSPVLGSKPGNIIDSLNASLGSAIATDASRHNRTNVVPGPVSASTEIPEPEPYAWPAPAVAGASSKYFPRYPKKNWVQRSKFMRSVMPGFVDIFDNLDDKVYADNARHENALSSWFLRKYNKMPPLPEDKQIVHSDNGISFTKPVRLVDIYDYVASNFTPPEPGFFDRLNASIAKENPYAYVLDHDENNPQGD